MWAGRCRGLVPLEKNREQSNKQKDLERRRLSQYSHKKFTPFAQPPFIIPFLLLLLLLQIQIFIIIKMPVEVKDNQCEVVLVGCGAPNRGMGWYHAVQMLRGDIPSAALAYIVEPWFLGAGT